MTDFIELTSQTSRDMRWLVPVLAIAFVRRKGPDDDASVLLVTGGTLEPAESYTEIEAMLAGSGSIA
jgi:hypothetical protein